MEEHRVKKPTSPCTKDCAKRSADCALTCSRLKVYKEHQNRYYAQRKQEQQSAADICEHQRAARMKCAHDTKKANARRGGL